MDCFVTHEQYTVRVLNLTLPKKKGRNCGDGTVVTDISLNFLNAQQRSMEL